MTMEIKAALYPVTEGEIPKAKEALERFKAAILEPMGAYVGGLTVMEASEPFPGTDVDRKVIKFQGHIHFNDGRTFSFGFGAHLAALRAGKRVARAGWNGKGMFLQLINPGEYSVAVPIVEGEVVPLLPWIGMKTAGGEFVPWLASQTDMLADDWAVVS